MDAIEIASVPALPSAPFFSSAEELAALRHGNIPAAALPRLRARVANLEARAAALGASPTGKSDAETERRRAAALARDIGAGRVVAIDGEVAADDWGRLRFVPRISLTAGPSKIDFDRSLLPPPLPGPWRAYVLPEHGALLGAEASGAAIAGRPSPRHLSVHQALLAERQGLTVDDFAELAAGHIPARAARWSKRAGLSRLALAAVLAASGAFFGVAFSVGQAPGLSLGPLPIRASYALAVPFLVLCAIFSWSGIRHLLAMRSVAVSFSGPARLSKTRIQSRRAMTLEVGGRLFDTSSDRCLRRIEHMLYEGWPYRAFVAESTDLLLALEPLAPP